MRLGHTASNAIAFVAATLLLLINEGIFSNYETIGPQIGRIYIYRDGCPANPSSARVLASAVAEISSLNYFSRSSGGTLELHPDGLLSGCDRFAIDLSDLDGASVLSVTAVSPPPRPPTTDSLTRDELERLSEPVSTELDFSRVGSARYEIAPPADIHISTLKVRMSGIIKRLGPSEFGSYHRVDFMDGATERHETGAPVDLRPSIGQRNATPFAPNIAVSQLSFMLFSEPIHSLRSSITVILSIFVGLFGGVAYEAYLADRRERRETASCDRHRANLDEDPDAGDDDRQPL